MKRNVVILIAVMLLLTGCGLFKSSTPDPVSPGPTETELTEGAKQQGESTKIIGEEATKVKTTTKEPATKKSAEIIISENDKLRDLKVLLERASTGKVQAEKELEAERERTRLAEEDAAKWKEKYDGKMSKWMILLKLLGVVCIPLGIFLMLKVAGEWIWISIMGVILIITGMIVEWIEAHFEWIFGGIVLAAIFAIARLWFQQNKATDRAVARCEALKYEVKQIDEPDVKTGTGKEILDKVFGNYYGEGVMADDPVTKRLINQGRKKFKLENDPIT